MTTFLFWNYMEVTVGLLAACLPPLKAFVSRSSLDSILNTVRHKLSLPSISSGQASRGSIRHGAPETVQGPEMMQLDGNRPSGSSRSEMLNLYAASDTTARAIPRVDDAALNAEVIKYGIVADKYILTG